MTTAPQTGLSAANEGPTRHGSDLASLVAGHLPYLRRYARALTGTQASGDSFAAATLEAVLEDPSVLRASDDPKVGLFHAFHLVWASAGAPVVDADTRLSAMAQAHMAMLTPNTREALLLNVIEGFAQPEIAAIMQIGTEDVAHLIQVALQEMEASVAGRVLIIEDEAIIAMNLSAIVQEMPTGFVEHKAVNRRSGGFRRLGIDLAGLQQHLRGLLGPFRTGKVCIGIGF